MIDDRNLQKALAAQDYYNDTIDGHFGPKSQRAMRRYLIAANLDIAPWIDARCKVALAQSVMADAHIETGPIDGLIGPQTRFAFERWQDDLRRRTPKAVDVTHQPSTFPRQKNVPAYFGAPGTEQFFLTLPFPMRLAWQPETLIQRFSIHRRVHDSAARAFAAILDHYGEKKISQLGLNLFGGCLNVRTMRGGRRASMHSWGIAIDFDPEHNRLRWGSDRARLAKPECAAFLNIWESEGWISLGRERNFDWMHIQAARL